MPGINTGWSGGYTRQMPIDVVERGGIEGQTRSDLQSLAHFVGQHASQIGSSDRRSGVPRQIMGAAIGSAVAIPSKKRS